MDLREFTEITLAVVQEHGIEVYAPTIIAREAVRVIQGIPPEVDHREAIQITLRDQGLADQDFFFGVRSGPRELTTGHHTAEGTRFMRILGMQQGYMMVDVDGCDWWDPDPQPGH